MALQTSKKVRTSRYPKINPFRTVTKALILLTSIVILALILRPSPNKTTESSTTKTNDTSQSQSNSSTSPGISDSSTKLLIGSPSAQTVVIQYGDYKCPQCASFHQGAEKQIRQKYIDSGQVAIEYRPYPYIGPDSGRAARGAFCANEQGKFAAYHDAIYNYMWLQYYKDSKFSYEIEDVLTLETLTKLASTVKINTEAFRSCVAADKYNSTIDQLQLTAADDEVQGTPTFLIGGQKVVGPQPFAVFEALIALQIR